MSIRSGLEKMLIASGKFEKNQVAVMETSQIIGLLISAVFLSALLPTVMTNLIGINTSGWGATETTLIGLLPVFIAIVIVGKYARDV